MASDESHILRQENLRLREENQRKDQRIALLEQKIDALVRRIFGAKSESFDPSQLELLLDPEAAKKSAAAAVPDALAADGTIAKGSRRKQPRAPRIPDHRTNRPS